MGQDTIQRVHGFRSKSETEPAISIAPRLYAPQNEIVCLKFFPLCRKNVNPQWEDWHCYRSVLTILKEDYRRLLLPYFNEVFPVKDPISGELQVGLNICFDNWIPKDTWSMWLSLIQGELQQKTALEHAFYQELLAWVETALTFTDVIIVEGNQ